MQSIWQTMQNGKIFSVIWSLPPERPRIDGQLVTSRRQGNAAPSNTCKWHYNTNFNGCIRCCLVFVLYPLNILPVQVDDSGSSGMGELHGWPEVIVWSGCRCAKTESVTLICSSWNRTEPDTGYSHSLECTSVTYRGRNAKSETNEQNTHTLTLVMWTLS